MRVAKTLCQIKATKMITWSGFISKIIEYAIKKIADKRIGLSNDKKYIASKTFLELYENLIDIENVTKEVVNSIDLIVEEKKPVLFYQAIISIAPSILNTSNSFLNSLNKTGPVLSLYDPKLANILFLHRRGKGGYISELVRNIESNHEFKVRAIAQRNLDYLRYTTPMMMGVEEKLNQLDLRYKEYDDKYEDSELSNLGRQLSISDNPILNELEVNSFEVKNDIESLRNLRSLLIKHKSSLSHTRILLMNFIKSNFSIEDLLFADRRRKI